MREPTVLGRVALLPFPLVLATELTNLLIQPKRNCKLNVSGITKLIKLNF